MVLSYRSFGGGRSLNNSWNWTDDVISTRESPAYMFIVVKNYVSDPIWNFVTFGV